MGGPEMENSILEVLRQKQEGTRYIHVYPGEIKVYSLLEGGIKGRKESGAQCAVPMMECSRESLTGFRMRGTPIPVIYVKLPADRPGEDVKAFLKMVRETGFLIETGGVMYAVSHTALRKLHVLMEMYGAHDYSPIHDVMLAEKLLAVEPCRLRPKRKESLERVDKKNAKGYTLAVQTGPFEGSAFVDGMITGMYSGWYEGTEGEDLESLCRKLAGGDIIKGKTAELLSYSLLEDGVEAEFVIGEPLRYSVRGEEYTLTAGMVVTDGRCGYRAFSIRGTVSDPVTGDCIIVSEKKHNHYGRAGSAAAGPKAETAKEQVLKAWEETEDFLGLLEKCMKMPDESAGPFQERAVSAGIRGCIGKKRTAALFGTPPGSAAEALHRIIHTKSTITAAEGIKNLAAQDGEKLRKVIACAIREAYRTPEVHTGAKAGEQEERREGGAPFVKDYGKDTGSRQADAGKVQRDPGGRTVH